MGSSRALEGCKWKRNPFMHIIPGHWECRAKKTSPLRGNESLLCLQGEVLLNRELSGQGKRSRELRMDRWAVLLGKGMGKRTFKENGVFGTEQWLRKHTLESASGLLFRCSCSAFLSNCQSEHIPPPYPYLSAHMIFLLGVLFSSKTTKSSD